MKIALITPSFERDFPLCEALCHSLDKFNEDALEHILIVPRRDLALFRPLVRPTRRLVADGDVLPRWVQRVPAPPVIDVPFVGRKRLRTLHVTPRLHLIRGWILQQVLKCSANTVTDADGFVFLDSDIVFVRPFKTESFVQQDKLPLHRIEKVMLPPNPEYRSFADWDAAARKLLGLQPAAYGGDNYVAAVVCWRRDRLVEMQRRIEAVTGKEFRAALLAEKALSEYALYGVFCDAVCDGDAGHFPQTNSLCHEDWSYDMTSNAGLEAFINGLQPYHLSVLMQSTNDWSMERRRAVVNDIQKAAGLPV
ncbi:MAG: DUF6492 family protein [Pseudomonadota bacterium]